MKNRRNYYRILHVQPEAPLEIIKASYRSLMTKLGAHPDRGGDHDTAVLINQAYAVLCDPDSRRRYDAELAAARRPAYPPAASARRTSAPATRPAPVRSPGRAGYGNASGLLYCAFCAAGTPVTALLDEATRCASCASPLVRAGAARVRPPAEARGRRSAPRIAKHGTVLVFPEWPHPGVRAELRDLSLAGLSLYADFAPRAQQVLKLESPLLVGVMRVSSVRRTGGRHCIHGPLLAAEFATQSGSFVSARV